jgi:carbon monoxide dehydrogenase subunit G
MIETSQSILIDASIDDVWGYVKDIRRWASLFPGCRDCTVTDERDSRWILKVGAGGLVRTVNALVHVDQWSGPERVDFSFELEGDPVQGSGSYVASRAGDHATEVTLNVCVAGTGPVAPLWEAVSRPLLPTLAKHFARQLKAEIEKEPTSPGRPQLCS